MKVYFNGACNICNAGISHYKKKTCDINYVDISKDRDEHIHHLSKKDLFRRMHVYHQGRLISGSESFLILWDTMPRWRYLSSFLKLPVFKQLWKIAYETMALLLYYKNKSKIWGEPFLQFNHKNGFWRIKVNQQYLP